MVLLDIGAVSRPHPGFEENGDAYLVRPYQDGAVLVAVVDALGHGPEAARIAEKALDFLSASTTEGLGVLLRGCHEHLKGMRGAAIALVRIEPLPGRLHYCGVGNVEARLAGQTPARPISYNGIVGAVLPSFKLFDFSFRPGDLLLLHTDGISARFNLAAYGDLTGQPAQLIAAAIARDWARPTDDATILVLRHL
ncbi:MAG TPA: SpoIIE family protein phosphatase [Ardenticatenaceae bacterium]|nr:SpoIIE family protein phosphatase [Ardenticatenaceae bacterium]